MQTRLPEDRYVHLVLENDKNEARYLSRTESGQPRHYVAQWNDDIHHAMHVILTGEERGYYADYADEPLRHLARCLTEGFAYQDDPSAFRNGERRGELSAHLPPAAFVAFVQNHDQIGNRAFGDRLASLAPPEAVRAGLAVLLLSPLPPLLFQGEEWASVRPFLFFCDFGEDLREAVREGRRKEFAGFPEFADEQARARIPDPTAIETFEQSKLDWSESEKSPHRETLAETRHLLALRRDEIAPRLVGMKGHSGCVAWSEGCCMSIVWQLGDGIAPQPSGQPCASTGAFGGAAGAAPGPAVVCHAPRAGGRWRIAGVECRLVPAGRSLGRSIAVADIPTTPRATYRLQFNRDFTFADAERIAPYLAKLGVSHLYASPYLKARPGSTHGYDITDHNAFNPEIGDDAAFVAFSDSLHRNGLGQILDFVPNHMGIGHDDNAWWLDVLEWGEESLYAQYFDIDWYSAKEELRGKVLIPSLGEHYGRVLEAGELKLGFDAEAGTFSVWYYDHRFPITPGEYSRILRVVLSDYGRLTARDNRTVIELEDLVVGFRDVGDWSPKIRQPVIRRAEADGLKKQLARLVEREPEVADVVDIALGKLNGRTGDPESLLWMHELLEAQHYRLAYWRVAAEEINYRRFFQINDLAGIRVELPAVFEAIHQLVFNLIRQGRVHGLRIDHIDGLFDPKQYLERLQRRIGEELAFASQNGGSNGDGPGAQLGQAGGETVGKNHGEGNGGRAASAEAAPASPFYVIVEKILAPHERLREDWPIAGTSGYEFLNRVHGLFVDPDGEAPLRRIYDRFLGEPADFEEIAYDSKRQVMDFELASELRVLASEYNRLTEGSWLTRDYTLVGLRQALREVVACFPVYRTYVDAAGAAPPDHRDIDWAIARARRRSMRGDKSVFDFIQAALTTELSSGPSHYNRREVRRLAMKFQQYTGPVAAKGVEDTAFYRFNLLASNNEVGGEPSRFGTTVSAFHKVTQDAARRWPNAMLATATHDTKRGEDARVRIDVLSEIPTDWGRRVRRWATLNYRRKVLVNDQPAPSANDEYLFYQALVGSWPAEFHDAGDLDPQQVEQLRERLSTYMIKAVREAKISSSWLNPDIEYEDALLSLVSRCLDVSRANPFLDDFRAFHRTIAVAGAINGLSQVVLKMTTPGVPDFYQGSEVWELSLVDPDNRRPVDFAEREARLTRIADAFAQQGNALASDLLSQWPDGSVKMFVIWRLLSLRRDHAAVFARSSYTPVDTAGMRADHLCAFTRGDGTAAVLVVAPRLIGRLLVDGQAWPLGESVWGDTELVLPAGIADGEWTDVFTGRRLCVQAEDGDVARVNVGEVLINFPVAALVRSSAEGGGP